MPNVARRKETAQGSQALSSAPRSLTIAKRGIRNSKDFRDAMSAIMSDLIEGRITPSVGNASCNAGGKLLRMVELEYKYGTDPQRGGPARTLTLAFEEPDKKQLGSETQRATEAA